MNKVLTCKANTQPDNVLPPDPAGESPGECLGRPAQSFFHQWPPHPHRQLVSRTGLWCTSTTTSASSGNSTRVLLGKGGSTGLTPRRPALGVSGAQLKDLPDLVRLKRRHREAGGCHRWNIPSAPLLLFEMDIAYCVATRVVLTSTHW